MLDWLAISTAAVSLLTPFVKKAGDKVSEKMGEAIFAFVKGKFKGDSEAESTISSFEKKPERYGSALVDILKERAESDPAFGEALKNMLEEKRDDARANKVMQIAKGTNIAQATGTGASASVVGGSTAPRRPRRKR